MRSHDESIVDRHLTIGFRDLYIRDIVHANDGDVRMGTFVLCAAFLDALSLAYSAGLRVKGGSAGRWSQFIERHFRDEYAFLRDAYDGFRCKLLHNYSARGIAFTHGPENAFRHLQPFERDGVFLHRESFVKDVLSAFDSFERDAHADPGLQRRLAAHFEMLPPMGLVVVSDDAAALDAVAEHSGQN